MGPCCAGSSAKPGTARGCPSSRAALEARFGLPFGLKHGPSCAADGRGAQLTAPHGRPGTGQRALDSFAVVRHLFGVIELQLQRLGEPAFVQPAAQWCAGGSPQAEAVAAAALAAAGQEGNGDVIAINLLNHNPGAGALVGLPLELVHHATALAALGFQHQLAVPFGGGGLADQTRHQRHGDGPLVPHNNRLRCCIVAASVVVVSDAHPNAAQAIVGRASAVLTQHAIAFARGGIASWLLRW